MLPLRCFRLAAYSPSWRLGTVGPQTTSTAYGPSLRVGLIHHLSPSTLSYSPRRHPWFPKGRLSPLHRHCQRTTSTRKHPSRLISTEVKPGPITPRLGLLELTRIGRGSVGFPPLAGCPVYPPQAALPEGRRAIIHLIQRVSTLWENFFTSSLPRRFSAG